MNRLVVVSNRVPDPSSGSNQAGGLAVALEGVMEKRGGLWFGWSGKTASGAASQPIKIAKHGQIDFATVDLTPDEHDTATTTTSPMASSGRFFTPCRS